MKPEYALANGNIKMNEAAMSLTRRKLALLKELDCLEASYVGSALASMFVKFPWLAEVEIRFEATVYRDDESMCTNITSNLLGLTYMRGVPSSEGESASTRDSVAAAALVNPLLRDAAESLHHIHTGWNGSMPPVDVKVTRKALAVLLKEVSSGAPLSGAKAFAVIFPVKAKDLGMVAPAKPALVTA